MRCDLARSGCDDEAVSRFMSRVLRHDARKFGLTVRADGYVLLTDLLNLEFLCSRHVLECDVTRIVESNAKRRFGICVPDGEEELHIRAHQGHTIRSVRDEALLEVVDASELPVLCHGTFSSSLPLIQQEGIKTMGRNHIHLVCKDLTLERNDDVISGTRGEFDTIVYVDACAAMGEGVIFHRSANDVVLTRGSNGVLPPHLFTEVATWNWEVEEWSWHLP